MPVKVSAPPWAQTISSSVGSGIRQAAKSASRCSAAKVPRPPSSSEETACRTTSPGSASRRRAQRGQRVQRRDDAALHVGRAAPVQRAAGDLARERIARPRLAARADDVDVAVDAQPRRRRIAARQGDGGADELRARGLLAGVAGIGPQRREVVLLQARVEAELAGDRDERERRRALLAGDAGHPHEAPGVAGERGAIERVEGGGRLHVRSGRLSR